MEASITLRIDVPASLLNESPYLGADERFAYAVQSVLVAAGMSVKGVTLKRGQAPISKNGDNLVRMIDTHLSRFLTPGPPIEMKLLGVALAERWDRADIAAELCEIFHRWAAT